MTTNEKQNKQPEAGKKELTPRQIQMRKKMVVFPLFFLAFAGCMWLIFSPGEKEREEPSAGFNTELPTPESEGILSDKRDAYVQEEMRRREREKMRSLQDFAFGMEDEEEEPVMPAAVPDKSSGPAGGSSGAFRTSRAAYADINRQLGSFYEETAGETGEEREMQARIEELERRLEEQQAQKTAQEEQVALLEKSYEIAARYMNGGQAPEAPRQKASVSGKASVQPVRQVRRNIVSLLAAPLPDSVFAREFVKPRNWGFNTVGSDLREPERNSIRAAVQQTVTLTDGGEVTFRLLEPMMAGDLLIPSGTPVTGAARINGERLTVKVSAVQHGGAVVPVDLSVYDTNGNEGIPVPGSEELNAVKEIAANMGAGMGSSITITDDAGSQLLSDLGRSAIQGVSQYVSKKMRSVKVTLKAGYSVLLLPPPSIRVQTTYFRTPLKKSIFINNQKFIEYEKDSSGTRFYRVHVRCPRAGKALHGRFVRRSYPSADLQPGYPALRAGGDVQQDRACDFPLGHPLRRSGVFGSSGGESRRHGKRAACKGGPA